MRAALALLVVSAVSATALANPIEIDDEMRRPPPQLVIVEPPPPPPPPKPREPLRTWLGLRFGAGSIPVGGLSVTTIGLIQFDAEVEIVQRMRVFGEYDFYIASATQHDAMATSIDGIDHRFDGGVIVDVLAPTVPGARFPISVEAGGGIDLISGQFGARRVPITFAGLRAGFELFDRHEKGTHRFEFQLTARAISAREGIGSLFGLGLQWRG